jgi:hypothetical protein
LVEQRDPRPDDPRAERTIRRWRRAFLGLYLTFTFGAVIVAFFSILAVQCGGIPLAHTGPRIQDVSDPIELRSCATGLDRLLRDLHREALTVQQTALRFDIDPAREWQNWAEAWHMRWRALAYRCRFQEASGSNVSPELRRMVEIHTALDELQFAYGGLVSRLAGNYAQRLRRLSSQLQEVHNLIDRRKPPGQGADPDRRGATR